MRITARVYLIFLFILKKTKRRNKLNIFQNILNTMIRRHPTQASVAE